MHRYTDYTVSTWLSSVISFCDGLYCFVEPKALREIRSSKDDEARALTDLYRHDVSHAMWHLREAHIKPLQKDLHTCHTCRKMMHVWWPAWLLVARRTTNAVPTCLISVMMTGKHWRPSVADLTTGSMRILSCCRAVVPFHLLTTKWLFLC